MSRVGLVCRITESNEFDLHIDNRDIYVFVCAAILLQSTHIRSIIRAMEVVVVGLHDTGGVSSMVLCWSDIDRVSSIVLCWSGIYRASSIGPLLVRQCIRARDERRIRVAGNRKPWRFVALLKYFSRISCFAGLCRESLE